MTRNDSIKNTLDLILRNIDELDFNNWHVLVTGGAGFLGSWMCDTLVEKGSNVICVDNLSSGLRENIKHLEGKPNFRFIKDDVTRALKIKEKLVLIIHMASQASPFEFSHSPIDILRANTLGTMNMLELAMKKKARFLFTSTSEVYGNPEVVPTPETYYGYTNSVGVRSCYDESKRCGEAYAMAYYRQHGLDVRIARIFNTYGPRMRADDIYGRVVPRFIEQAINGKPITIFGTGDQTRSFCYVTDQITGLLKLAYSPQGKGKVVNIGNISEITIKELADLVKYVNLSRSEISYQPLPEDDPRRRCADINVASNLLNWKPEIDLYSGLCLMRQWLNIHTEEKLCKTYK